MENITIGYLSWKRHDVFNQTLSSHKSNGLFDCILPKNRLIYFQEINEIDIALANKYGCNYIGSKENVGILNAFVALVENCKTDYFIFCENDWLLIEKKNVTFNVLQDCIDLIKNNVANIIKLRHRTIPGNPNHSKNVWNKNDCSNFPYKLESLHWLKDDEIRLYYNNIMSEYILQYLWYITDLVHQRWSNNIFIANTHILKNCVLPLLKLNANENTNKYLGLEDILINYDKYYETNNEVISNYKNNIKLAQGKGLFTHCDFILF